MRRLMRLREFQVTNFRNVVDSRPIEVDDQVTCLVGKNESGKTALLQALYRLNPVYPSDSFDEQEHYPRWLLTRHRKAGQIDGTVAIQATFELDDGDREAVAELLGEGVLTGDALVATNGYGRALSVEVEADEAAAVRELVGDTLPEDSPLRGELSGLASVAELREALSQAGGDQAAATAEQAAEEAEEGAEAPATPVEQTGYRDVERLRSELGELYPGEEGAADAAARILVERVPRFFYFSRYSTLPGRVDLRQLDPSEAQMPGVSGLQTARALLELAGTDISRLSEDEYEVRKAELEAVSTDLTREVRDFWGQGEHLDVDIDVDKETVPGEPTPHGTGLTAVARFLDVRVRDRRHGYTDNFGQRSSGFQWFFSFLAAFSEFESMDEPVVVLLDEPALTLHGRAQGDFLRFIDDRLARDGRQVIYTTHSPFMVDPAGLDRVRIVEDKGVELGSVTSSDVLSVDRDSLFPLQGALGYDVAQSLFIGPDNILVEGTSDWTYLTVISDHLREIGREGLDERWRILPTGGAQNIPAFVALLGRHLDVTVLVDAGTQGMQRLHDMAAKGLLPAGRLVTVAEVTGAANADIEDVFSVGDYLKLYNLAFGASLTAKGLPPGDRIVRRIAAAIGTKDFDHGRPADALLRHRDKLLGSLSATTLDGFETLFKRLNATAPPAS
jgi:predicted ATPase